MCPFRLATIKHTGLVLVLSSYHWIFLISGQLHSKHIICFRAGVCIQPVNNTVHIHLSTITHEPAKLLNGYFTWWSYQIFSSFINYAIWANCMYSYQMLAFYFRLNSSAQSVLVNHTYNLIKIHTHIIWLKYTWQKLGWAPIILLPADMRYSQKHILVPM